MRDAKIYQIYEGTSQACHLQPLRFCDSLRSASLERSIAPVPCSRQVGRSGSEAQPYHCESRRAMLALVSAPEGAPVYISVRPHFRPLPIKCECQEILTAEARNLQGMKERASAFTIREVKHS
eukprot:2298236-Pleurochrysis_carterae.AAC.2